VPLTIEDGTNVADANSYVTRAEIIAYAAARGVTIADDAGTDVLAIKAMDFIESRRFNGERVNGLEQPLEWPRKYVIIGEEELPTDTIPKAIKKAESEAVLLLSQGIELMPNRNTDAYVKSEKVGSIETEYFGAPNVVPTTPTLDAILRPYVVGIGFGINVIRG